MSVEYRFVKVGGRDFYEDPLEQLRCSYREIMSLLNDDDTLLLCQQKFINGVKGLCETGTIKLADIRGDKGKSFCAIVSCDESAVWRACFRVCSD